MSAEQVFLIARQYGNSWGVEPLAVLKCCRNIVINLAGNDQGLEAEAIRYTASMLEVLIKTLSALKGDAEIE